MNLFSTYSQGENRVTAALLAVLSSLSHERMSRILGSIMEQSEFELVSFRNQSKGKNKLGVPDAEIVCNCRILLETKTEPNKITREQVKQYLDRLDKEKEHMKKLILLSPDGSKPNVLDDINNACLTWTSFQSLNDAIDDLLKDETEVISEREVFLLQELRKMFLEEELIGLDDNTVLVIPAKYAWGLYEKYSAYVCQSRRSFRKSKYLAFYTNKKIMHLIPAIKEVHEEVIFEPDLHNADLKKFIDNYLKNDIYRDMRGNEYKVFILSSAKDKETINIDKPIEHIGKAAFVQRQCYVSLDSIKSAKNTSDLKRL